MENTPLDSQEDKDHKTGIELKSISEIRAFRKLIFKESQEVVDSGGSKKAYFEKTIDEYGNIHEKSVAQIIGFALPSMVINENKNFIYALIVLQVLTIFSFFFFVYEAYFSNITTIPMFFLVFSFILECLILSYLLRFNGQILGGLISLGVIKFVGSANELLTNSYDTSLLINLSISLLILLIAAYLKNKLYPQYKLWGGPKKDALGNYQF